MQIKWHQKQKSEIYKLLKTRESGLSLQEAQSRLAQNGENKLPETKPPSILVLFLSQFRSPLIYLLLAAAIIVYYLQEQTDAYIILFVLFFNAVVGTFQEGKAQNTLAALKKYVETKTVVMRNGQQIPILDTQTVSGDLLVLQEGDKIPADIRIIESHTLQIDEATLTGESQAVYKTSDALSSEHLELPDQKNMAFKGTHIVSGWGKGIVVATGTDTVIGSISRKIIGLDEGSPLKKDIRQISRLVIASVIGISLIILVLGISTGKDMLSITGTIVSLAVSVIPEGLPIVLTLVLAFGVWRMSKKQALVKKLQAVEALGQADIICLDKTGTITSNELVVNKIYTSDKIYNITGKGYDIKGEISFEGKEVKINSDEHLHRLIEAAALVTNAQTIEGEDGWQAIGDPTEAALTTLAKKNGFDKDDLDLDFPRIAENPFDYRLKYHTVTNKYKGKRTLTMIGAPETVLDLCNHIYWNKQELDIQSKNKFHGIYKELAEEGLRVLGLAVKDNTKKNESPENLLFLGFIAMQDTLRPYVRQAVEKSFESGLRVAMITGDNKITAMAIAKQAGIYHEGDQILTGDEVDKFSDEQLSELVETVSVMARFTPEHKLKIIQAFRNKGLVVAMTGDGVNDAPSLVAADLGIAMGRIGTEVAKEASDIVLLDDNFGSIIAAIEEGRSIYKTIKKVVLYLFSTSLGEALTIIGALLLSLPIPILPSQIIWLNFVTDGFLTVALAMEPKEKNLLQEKHLKKHRTKVLDKTILSRMGFMAWPMAIGSIVMFGFYYQKDLAYAWTVSLTVLAVFQWFNAWNCRSDKESIFRMDVLGNLPLLYSTGIVIALQIFAVYHPFGHKFLHTVPLAMKDWVIICIVSASIIMIEETRKYIYRKSLSPSTI